MSLVWIIDEQLAGVYSSMMSVIIVLDQRAFIAFRLRRTSIGDARSNSVVERRLWILVYDNNDESANDNKC